MTLGTYKINYRHHIALWMGKRGRGETEMTRGGNSEKEHSKDNKDENWGTRVIAKVVELPGRFQPVLCI